MDTYDLALFLERIPGGWPTLLLALGVLLLLAQLATSSRSTASRLSPEELPLHEIRTTLACSSEQAARLLEMYDGSSARAIMEVKTGRAVVPTGQEGDLPAFGGEIRHLHPDGERLTLVDRQDRVQTFPWDQEGYLALGLLQAEKKPDRHGFTDATRGRLYGHLCFRIEGRWLRFMLDGGRVDYSSLGERLQNTGARNLRLLLGDLVGRATRLALDDSVRPFVEGLRARPYSSLAEFERQVLARLRQWDAPTGRAP